ncbi:MAG TPA: diaminopimelate epimerase [Gemmatimonadales bacterium]|nr:diaminopimelate epimerase [Gemmatimonadales bacterium]
MIRFHKMTGSGNDFVFLDGREQREGEWPSARIAQACDRRHGIGGDGLVFLTPESAGVVRMAYFNADGGRAAMCGNAALCSTRLAARLRMADPAGMRLATDAGVFETRCTGPGHMAEIHLGDVARPRPVPGIALIGGERSVALATVGVPHLVILVDDIEAVDIAGRGRALRFHPALGAPGANANFVARPSVPDGPWLIRTYERGVEGETLACGTGTVAAAIALAEAGVGELPMRFVSRGGAPLAVSAVLNESGATNVWLCGEGRLVFTGELLENETSPAT